MGEGAVPRPASTAACPICGKPVEPGNPARPFCSPRCKMVDLGRWFTEAYRVAGSEEDAALFDDLPAPPTERPPEEKGPGHDG